MYITIYNSSQTLKTLESLTCTVAQSSLKSTYKLLMSRKGIAGAITWLTIVVGAIYAGVMLTIYFIKVDGGYTEWSQLTSCSKSCEGGTKSRTRSCTNPIRAYGGKDCSELGPDIQTISCNTQHCPVNGKYGEWSDFGDCSVKCGGGEQKRERKCDQPVPEHGGKDCEEQGPSAETKKCNEDPCPVDGKYSAWSGFGECTASCGGGSQTRERKCNNPEPQHGGRDCGGQGADKETKNCNEDPCPVNGGYSDWKEWGECSVPCGPGKRTRKRECNNPTPAHGGKSCEELGGTEETADCNLKPCESDSKN